MLSLHSIVHNYICVCVIYWLLLLLLEKFTFAVQLEKPKSDVSDHVDT